MFNIEETTIDNESEGSWAKFKGSNFLIASINKAGFQKMFARLQVPHRKDIDKGRLDPDIMLDITARSMSKYLLLDWSDVVDGAGNTADYSSEIAYKALKSNSELRDFVTNFATDLGNFLDEAKEDLGKPVEKSSDGKSSTVSEKSS